MGEERRGGGEGEGGVRREEGRGGGMEMGGKEKKVWSKQICKSNKSMK